MTLYDKYQDGYREGVCQGQAKMFVENVNHVVEKKLMKSPHKPIDIFNSVEIWTWEEYQEQQGFNVAEGLLEIIH